MKIYIVRHGETNANKKGLLQGSTDTELSDLGVKLAIETGIGLKDIKFDAVFSSPLKRAYDTAKLILSKNEKTNCEIITDDRLKEINMGDWEGQSFKGKDSILDPDKVKMFFENPFNLEPFPNGEDALTVCKRTQDFINWLVKNNNYQTVLITTHGFALRALLNFMYENKNDFWQGQVPYNCAVNIIEFRDNKFSFIEKDKVYYSKENQINRYKL